MQEPGRRPLVAANKQITLLLLTVILALNFLDRQIIIILQEPIKHEFDLADWQLGLVTGGVVGIFYTLAGLPLANLADRGINRTRMIATATATWSVMTVLCGLSRSFGQLLLARIGVGITEAAMVPSAHSMIADLYDARQRPRAMGIFSTGIPIGMMVGVALGGIVAQATSWRIALFAAGGPGILAALLFFLLTREPRRGAMESAQPVPAASIGFFAAVDILGRRPPIVRIICAMTVSTFVQTGISAWLPSFLIRVHGVQLANAGIFVGVLFGVSGIVGTVFGGWQASKAAVRGQHATLWLPIAGLGCCIPIFAAAFTAQTTPVVLGLLFVPMILSATWTAPALALLQSLAPVPVRARASALASMTANLLGLSLGPLAVGFLSDVAASWHNGDVALGLRDALLLVLPLFGIGTWQWWKASQAVWQEQSAGAVAEPLPTASWADGDCSNI
jgi:MFS transporter, Spinster family, sphingosine-1-phosphate transporter